MKRIIDGKSFNTETAVVWAGVLAVVSYVNFLVRIGLVYRHFGAGDPTKS